MDVGCFVNSGLGVERRLLCDPAEYRLDSQLGTSAVEVSTGVSLDGHGSVYITGETGGSLAAPFAGGYTDVFVARYDLSGSFYWAKQLVLARVMKLRTRSSTVRETSWSLGIRMDRQISGKSRFV